MLHLHTITLVTITYAPFYFMGPCFYGVMPQKKGQNRGGTQAKWGYSCIENQGKNNLLYFGVRVIK
jgi:hypothetical protein